MARSSRPVLGWATNILRPGGCTKSNAFTSRIFFDTQHPPWQPPNICPEFSMKVGGEGTLSGFYLCRPKRTKKGVWKESRRMPGPASLFALGHP